jgi:hypothetical protein
MITGAKTYRYNVHYKRNEVYMKGVKKGTRIVVARNMIDAVNKVKVSVPGSYEHHVIHLDLVAQ